MSAPSAKPLFQAIRRKPSAVPGQRQMIWPEGSAAAPAAAPAAGRDPLDFDPTPPSATRAFLAAEWPFALANGFGRLIAAHPPSVEYACTFKIDFRGQGNPAQRNCWFVWDRRRPGRADGAWLRRRLHMGGDAMQGDLGLGVT